MVGSKTKNKIGRPYAIDSVTVIMLEHAIKYDYGVAEACRYAGIGRTTYYAELGRNPEFAERMARARRYLIIKAKLIVADAILVDNDQKMAMWFLERRDPAFF